jgi:hypothetical protein
MSERSTGGTQQRFFTHSQVVLHQRAPHRIEMAGLYPPQLRQSYSNRPPTRPQNARDTGENDAFSLGKSILLVHWHDWKKSDFISRAFL